MSAKEKAEAVRAFLADGCWRPGREVEAVGGRRFGARVHEIRRGDDGGPPMAVECDMRNGESWWRMRPYRADEPRPSPPGRTRYQVETELEQLRQKFDDPAALRRRLEELERTKTTPQFNLFGN